MSYLEQKHLHHLLFQFTQFLYKKSFKHLKVQVAAAGSSKTNDATGGISSRTIKTFPTGKLCIK